MSASSSTLELPCTTNLFMVAYLLCEALDKDDSRPPKDGDSNAMFVDDTVGDDSNAMGKVRMLVMASSDVYVSCRLQDPAWVHSALSRPQQQQPVPTLV